MFKVEFYEDRNGFSPIEFFLTELENKTDKNSRINLNKIVAYIDILCEKGTKVGEPVTKHIKGKIWELRPLNNRILFFYHQNNKYVLLHCFVKKTNKTPQKEIEQAERNLNDYLERNDK